MHFCKSQYSQRPNRVTATERQTGKLNYTKTQCKLLPSPAVPCFSLFPLQQLRQSVHSSQVCCIAGFEAVWQLPLLVKGKVISPCWKPIWKLQSRNLTLQCRKKGPRVCLRQNSLLDCGADIPSCPSCVLERHRYPSACAGWGKAMLSEWPFLISAGIHLDEPFPHANLTGSLYITSSKSTILHRELCLGKGQTHVDSSWAAARWPCPLCLQHWWFLPHGDSLRTNIFRKWSFFALSW